MRLGTGDESDTIFPSPHPNPNTKSSVMKRLVLSLALVCSSVFAAGTQPSEASIKELLALSDAPKVIDAVMSQVDGMMQQMIAQATQGHAPTPAQQAAVDKYVAKAKSIMTEELTWAKLEPVYLRIYSESLNQAEVDGIIAFYKTPAGKAMVAKMPLLAQKTMAEMPGMMNGMMQKIQAAAQEFATDLQAAAKAEKAAE